MGAVRFLAWMFTALIFVNAIVNLIVYIIGGRDANLIASFGSLIVALLCFQMNAATERRRGDW